MTDVATLEVVAGERPHLAAALVAALAELTVVERSRTAKIATKTGSDYSYDYADLGDVVKVTRPVLAEHGIVALTPVHEHGDGLACTVILLHTLGERLDLGPFPFPHGNDAQATGSMVTYHRRYALVAALGMAAGDDDDGATAVPRQEHPAQQQPQPDQVTLDDVRPYIDKVKSMPKVTRDRLIELWNQPGEDGKPMLPTQEREGGQVPYFAVLKRSHIPVVEALILRAQRDTKTRVGERSEPVQGDQPGTPVGSSPPATRVEPAPGEPPVMDEEQPDWSEEQRNVNVLMQQAKGLLPDDEGDQIARHVWGLHHAKLDKELADGGEPKRQDEPIDLRRMRLTILRCEHQVNVRAEAHKERPPAEGPRENEEPF